MSFLNIHSGNKYKWVCLSWAVKLPIVLKKNPLRHNLWFSSILRFFISFHTWIWLMDWEANIELKARGVIFVCVCVCIFLTLFFFHLVLPFRSYTRLLHVSQKPKCAIYPNHLFKNFTPLPLNAFHFLLRNIIRL